MSTFSQTFADWARAHAPGRTQEIAVDAVVIGSGYGGAVAALRLAEEGRTVVVLERGAEFQPGDFPNHLGQLPKFLRAHGLHGTIGSLGGLLDVRVGLGMAAVTASGLGGGSLVNAGVMMRPDPDVFAQRAWPAEIRHGLDERRRSPAGQKLGLEAAFERARHMLGAEWFGDAPPAPGQGDTPPPVSQLPKAQALQRMGRAMRAQLATGSAGNPDRQLDFEARPALLTMDLQACKRCGDCFTGCNHPGAKRTLLTSYLQQAHAAGAQMITGALVYTLAPVRDGGRQQWLLRVLPTEAERHALKLEDSVACAGYTLRADLVVVAAGTFGSTELLLRSREHDADFSLSPELGNRLSGNGDSLSALADLPEPADGVGLGADDQGAKPVGPTITTMLDLRGRADLEQRVVIQEGAVPGALGRIYAELLATTWTLRHLGSTGGAPRANAGLEPLAATLALARRTQLLLAMGHDGSRGRVVWMPGMDAAVPFWDNPRDAPTYRRQQLLFDAAQAGGGVHLHPPTWNFVDPQVQALADGALPPPAILTVHPLGGCAMGDAYETGVVDHRGQVWRGPHSHWDNLYVLDGSIVPTSLGCNPLWTITALAERAMAHRRAAGQHPPTGRGAQPAGPVRAPCATSRNIAPPIDITQFERLELRTLPVRGALRAALGSDDAEADLELAMRAPDWFALWEDPRHRLEDISGTLRLAAGTNQAGSAPARKLAYTVTQGSIALFTREHGLWRGLCRLLRLPLVALTWWLLRGRRDRAERDRPGVTPIPWRRLLPLAWTATEVRHVRYDLQLALRQPPPDADAPAAPAGAPPQLWLKGHKVISYAATLRQIVVHVIARLFGGGSEGPRRPGDLRRSLLHQLTEPKLRLDTSPGMRLLPAPFAAASGRFSFDEQRALQRSPWRVQGGGDTTMAGFAALAYPLFLVRYLLRARLLEFRLPSYSNAPLRDVASDDDVVLRVGERRIRPVEYALHVPMGLSSSNDGSEPPADSLLRLRLWRYRRQEGGIPGAPQTSEGTWCGRKVRRARTVLLMHAFDMSGYSFTLKSVEKNFAEHLYEQGWEVWILDSRMSPRTQAAIEPCTVDQLGFIDAPHAVDFILARLRVELAGELRPDEKLQIHGFGQCMGAAAFLIGLLGGRLSYDVEADPAYPSATGVLPFMPKLAGLVTSQTHPFIVGSRTAQSKTWIPALLRDYAARTLVPLGVRGPVTSVVESLADRLFAGLPVPDGERCHDEGEVDRAHDDDCATCRRVRFLLGGMFLHRNLTRETHHELPKLFGSGSVRLFAQGAKFFVYERLCSEDGHNVYATEEAMSRYLALPLRFLHGRENDLFDQESATRSSDQYRRVHPGWAERYGRVDGPGTAKPVCDVIPDYGHVDVLIGAQASQAVQGGESVYERLADLLETAWSVADAQPAPVQTQERVIVRFPRSGPFLGPVVEDGDGQRSIGISFIVDDTNADKPEGAVALVGPPMQRRGRTQPAGVLDPGWLVELDLRDVPVSVPARDDQYRVPAQDALVGLRVASGRIPLPAGAGAEGLQVRCVSYSRTTAEPMADAGSRAPQPRSMAWQTVEGWALLGGPQPSASDSGPCTRSGVSRGQLEEAIRDARLRVRRLREDAYRPFPPTLSQQLRFPRHDHTMRATLLPQVLQPPRPEEVVRVAVGCCRYGGFPFERDRADAAYQGILQQLAQPAGDPLRMLLLLGDQIYADRTAGIVDALSPTERFFYRHQEAFTTVGARRLLSSLPTACVPDDHEFIDGYPLGRPLQRRGHEAARSARSWPDDRELAARAVAREAIRAYQLGQMPASAAAEGYSEFRLGRVRFFVLDTRTPRRRRTNGCVQTLTNATRLAYRRWLGSFRPDELGCLATGSVLLPGLFAGADPANMGPLDTMQVAPADRVWLLRGLAETLPGRFVLLSGDYHVSFSGEVCVNGRRVGAAIIAPPLYAPLIYANARPEDLYLGERITLRAGHEMTIGSLGKQAVAGSGHGTLDFRPMGTGWRVSLGAELIDFEQHLPRQAVQWPPVDLPGAVPPAAPGAAAAAPQGNEPPTPPTLPPQSETAGVPLYASENGDEPVTKA